MRAIFLFIKIASLTSLYLLNSAVFAQRNLEDTKCEHAIKTAENRLSKIEKKFPKLTLQMKRHILKNFKDLKAHGKTLPSNETATTFGEDLVVDFDKYSIYRTQGSSPEDLITVASYCKEVDQFGIAFSSKFIGGRKIFLCAEFDLSKEAPQPYFSLREKYSLSRPHESIQQHSHNYIEQELSRADYIKLAISADPSIASRSLNTCTKQYAERDEYSQKKQNQAFDQRYGVLLCATKFAKIAESEEKQKLDLITLNDIANKSHAYALKEAKLNKVNTIEILNNLYPDTDSTVRNISNQVLEICTSKNNSTWFFDYKSENKPYVNRSSFCSQIDTITFQTIKTSKHADYTSEQIADSLSGEVDSYCGNLIKKNYKLTDPKIFQEVLAKQTEAIHHELVFPVMRKSSARHIR